jgi:hypothetical protein
MRLRMGPLLGPIVEPIMGPIMLPILVRIMDPVIGPQWGQTRPNRNLIRQSGFLHDHSGANLITVVHKYANVGPTSTYWGA